MQSFKNIGLIGRLGSAKVVETLKRLIRFLDDAGYHVIVEDRTASALLDLMPAAWIEDLAAKLRAVAPDGGDAPH